MKDWIFIADAHLSVDDRSRQQLLIQFLEQNRDRMECLVILGDLFDFWFGFPDYVNPDYRPLCDTLMALRENGVRIIYLEGNHDFSLGPFFTRTLNGEVYPDSHIISIGDRRVYLAHGDGIDPWDLRYRIYRGLLKNKLVYRLIRWLGPDRSMKAKEILNRRKWIHRRREDVNRSLPDERFARRKFNEGMEVVILGHTHHPCEKTFVVNGRTCYYFNVGDWIEHFSYLRYHPDSGFRLEFFNPEDAPFVEPNESSPAEGILERANTDGSREALE